MEKIKVKTLDGRDITLPASLANTLIAKKRVLAIEEKEVIKIKKVKK